MRILNLYLFTVLFSKSISSIIPTKKICKDCRHFIGDNRECRKFGDVNIITGKVTYNSALSVREDVKKCGEDAIHFEENHFKIITVPYYFFKDHWPLLLLTGFFSFYIYAFNYISNK